MRKRILLLMAMLYISISIAGNVHALENGVTIPLVADKISNGAEAGNYLTAQVIVTNGTGHVFVDTNPYTQVDLQGSARIAASVASDVLGVDENSYDFYYIIEINSPIIGGPSAGGALTVATIAAMKNWSIKPGVAMTGMIDPDETIGPVGGIPFKLEAAAAKNTSLFLVPQGQLIVNVPNTTVIGQEDTVDLVKLGNKLGVTVKEVSTIQDAVLEFTGHDISKPLINKTVYTSNYLNLLKPLAIKLKNESENMYNSTSFINNSLVQNAKTLQNNADNLVNQQKYYAATSLYFGSMIDALSAQWIYQYNQENNKTKYMINITNIVEEQIKSSESDLNKYKSNGVSDVEVIGAAESRITQANNTLENVGTLNNPTDIITSLAFAYERARTAQWWLTLIVPSSTIIPEDVLRDRAGWYLGQAQSINTYTQALFSEAGTTSINIGDTTLAQKEIDKGYYSGAIFDSLQAISESSTDIELLGVQDPSARINQSANAAQSAINEARAEGIEPTLAVSAYEYGETLTNPFDKMYQYSYAEMVAKTTESLYAKAISSKSITNITVSNMTTPNNTTPAQKSPAFEAVMLLMTIMVIFVIRKYKNE